MNNERYVQPLALFFSLCCYCVFIIFSSIVLINLVDNNVNEILAKAESFSIMCINNFKPEPHETLIYILAMFTLPIVVPFFYFVIIKLDGTYLDKRLYNFSCLSVILFCLTISLYSINSNWGRPYFDFYLWQTVIFNRTTIFLFICSTLISSYIILTLKKSF